MRRMTRAISTVLCVCCMAVFCAACSSQQKEETTTSTSGVGPEAGTRIAASMKDYIDSMLEDGYVSHMSDAQREILERSSQAGEVSASDYELAWSNYKQCMVDRGYTTPVVKKELNGLYRIVKVSVDNATDEQIAKFHSDDRECHFSEVTDVETVYSTQIANPNLYANNIEMLMDCLHRTDSAPNGYSMTQLRDDYYRNLDLRDTKLDLDDPNVRTCLVSTAFSLPDEDTDGYVWKPFG